MSISISVPSCSTRGGLVIEECRLSEAFRLSRLYSKLLYDLSLFGFIVRFDFFLCCIGFWKLIYFIYPPASFQVFSAKRDGKVVGFSYLRGGASVDRLYSGVFVVGAERQSGIGGSLIEFSESWARLRGCKHLIAIIRKGNESSRKLFESRGFLEKEVVAYEKVF